MGGTSLILTMVSRINVEDMRLQEIAIEYMGISDRVRDVIRIPRPLRLVAAELVYSILRLRGIFELKLKAARELGFEPSKIMLFEYSYHVLGRVVDLVLTSYSVGVFALNVSVGLRLIERLLGEYKDDPLILTDLEGIAQLLRKSIDECSNYTSIPPRKLIDYYADKIEEEITSGLGMSL